MSKSGILDPVGLIQPERHLDQPAAKRRDQMQPGLDQLGQPLERQRLAARGGSRTHTLPTCP